MTAVLVGNVVAAPDTAQVVTRRLLANRCQCCGAGVIRRVFERNVGLCNRCVRPACGHGHDLAQPEARARA